MSLPKIVKLVVACCAAMAVIAPAQATTAAFLTRLYTEALGRAPDPDTWKANQLFANTPANCTSLDFMTIANNLYSSAEYSSLNYTNPEKVLTLYRGLLNREPDSAATVQYWSSLLDAGHPMSTLVSNIVTSSEFYDLRDSRICVTTPTGQNSSYRWGQQPAIPLLQGVIPMEGATLQAQLNAAGANGTVALPQGTVVYVRTPLVIPAGVTLTTAGTLRRAQYAKMARIVLANNFTGQYSEQPIINMLTDSVKGGSKLTKVWVSGQRDQVVNGQLISYSRNSHTIRVASGRSTVSDVRLDNPVGGSNLVLADAASAGIACSQATITGNLLTGYSNTHYSPADNQFPFSDGISSSCEHTTITDNTIIDASDVSIILFATGDNNVPQASIVSGNLLIAAGVSAYAAMMYEPYVYADNQRKTFSFAGSSFQSNTFYGTANTRFELGMVAGHEAWHDTNYNLGSGGRFANNSNAGIPTVMQVGIGVDGMSNTTVTGNSLSYTSGTGNCQVRAPIVADTSSPTESTPSLITGNTNNGTAASITAGSLMSCSF